MDIVSLIEQKKLGKRLADGQIDEFVRGAADGSIPDYQLGAMLMAIRLNGMDRDETTYLTLAMARSGDMVDLSGIGGIVADKHSTGGVGDTTTLVLVPLVAACGAPVAKMSGRGLGHTGGTLDKLESIRGFNINLGIEEFISQVKRVGCAVIGQTSELAPADRTLYALRNSTATVDSLPLIAGSIMSKKLASGAEAIVLDVKTGNGAIMRTLDESIELAQAMVRIGVDAGRRVVALVTDMDEPLGSHIGNALEVKEAIDVLAGRVKGPLLDVSLMLGSRMLALSGKARTADEGGEKLLEALESGRGLDKFAEMIRAQGGDDSVCRDVTLLPRAKETVDVCAARQGYIERMDAMRLGEIAQHMGAGRRLKTDEIDHSVGFVLKCRVGDYVSEGQPLATVHARSAESARAAAEGISEAVHIGGRQVERTKLLHAIVESDRVTRL